METDNQETFLKTLQEVSKGISVMTDEAVKNLKALERARMDIAKKCHPAFDELLLYSLERRHLDVPEYSNVLLARPEEVGAPELSDYLAENVRLFQLDEIAFDADEHFHLPGVESVLSSMRDQGHSLLFIVQGTVDTTCVFLGLSKFTADASDVRGAIGNYRQIWEANFPGSRIGKPLKADSSNRDEMTVIRVATKIDECTEFGVLTGIPSLKRDEGSQLFVQGLERLIRAMRGKTYTWISIADPIPQDAVRDAIVACQQFESDIHHLVKTDLSKATSNGKTVMLGLFGLAGEGKTEGDSQSDSETSSTGTTDTEGSSTVDTTSDTHSTSNAVGGSVSGGVKFIGTTATASVDYHRTWGDAHTTAKSIGKTFAHSAMASLAKGWVNTVTQSVASQYAGGSFFSFGQTWTKTTTVGQELLNRKAQYAEEILHAYEKRLQEGTALGMWNLGHYFCASDPGTYRQGIGVINSLFAGMDSTYEPPRAIKVPKDFRDTLRRFSNVYLRFADRSVSRDDVRSGRVSFNDHPLGFIFNGPVREQEGFGKREKWD